MTNAEDVAGRSDALTCSQSCCGGTLGESGRTLFAAWHLIWYLPGLSQWNDQAVGIEVAIGRGIVISCVTVIITAETHSASRITVGHINLDGPLLGSIPDRNAEPGSDGYTFA